MKITIMSGLARVFVVSPLRSCHDLFLAPESFPQIITVSD
jgi:hypothetical protein